MCFAGDSTGVNCFGKNKLVRHEHGLEKAKSPFLPALPKGDFL